ncbi:metallophosphoesterase family protein [Neobacillus sp. M.A.Huq-85]
MKLAFISDIHGNAVALEAVLDDIKKKEVDKVIVLGDICFRGPEPKRALEMVQKLHTQVIKGNADEWVVRGIRESEVPPASYEIMCKERDWTYQQLDVADFDYLNMLPTELKLDIGKLRFHAFHATPESLFEVVKPNESDQILETKMMVNDADIYIYAHIHMPYIRYINGKCIINIGSVGLPFDGLVKSSYALVEINEESFQTTIIRVKYDVNRAISQLHEKGYPNTLQIEEVLRNAKS